MVGPGDEALDNIAALISEENLARHGLPGQGAGSEGIAVARAYVKRPEDYPAVRRVCEERLPGVPLNYVVADVCRTDLLVEFEGIAFSHGPGRVRRCAGRRRAMPRRRGNAVTPARKRARNWPAARTPSCADLGEHDGPRGRTHGRRTDLPAVAWFDW